MRLDVSKSRVQQNSSASSSTLVANGLVHKYKQNNHDLRKEKLPEGGICIAGEFGETGCAEIYFTNS